MAKRVRHAGKRVRKIDPEKLAEALGASSHIQEEQESEGKKFIEITYIHGKERNRKRLYRLELRELDSYDFLGKAEGTDPMMCLYLATKYCTDFEFLAVGYITYRPENVEYSLGMAFYKKKA